MRKYSNEASRKSIAESYLAEQALRKEATKGSQPRMFMAALEIAKKRHASCRGVLGALLFAVISSVSSVVIVMQSSMYRLWKQVHKEKFMESKTCVDG